MKYKYTDLCLSLKVFPDFLRHTLLCLFILISSGLHAQQNKQGERSRAIFRDVISLKEIETLERLNPPVDEKFKVPNQYGTPGKREKNGIPRDRPVPPDAKVFEERGAMHRNGQGANQPLSPPPLTGFNGLDDNISSIPPDVNGGVGLNHLMVTLNSQYRIQNRSGAVLSTVSIATFWSGLGASGPFDPKTVYDPYNDRWITAAVSNSRSASSSLLVAVSQTGDPTGVWNRYRIDATGVDTMWLDFPSMGFNKDWIVISGNMFGNVASSYQTCVLYLLDKWDFYNNGSGLYTYINAGNDAFTLAPSLTYDNSHNTVYLAESYNGNFSGSGYIRLFTLTGSVGSEVLSSGTYASTPNPWEWGTGTDFAPQLGSSSKIRCNDDRMLNCIYRNGSVWLAHSVFLPAGTPTRASLQWWRLNPSGAVNSRSRIDDSTGNMFYAFPSIAVNSADDVLMGYSVFSSTMYASGAYSLKLSTDAEFQSSQIYKSGEAKYYKTYSGTANRWGDYSLTQVDPVNDLDFWTLQEYAMTPGTSYDRWGTWWANVSMTSPVADFDVDQSSICTNGSVTFSSLSTGSISSYLWNFGSGAIPSTSTSSGPVTVQYTTPGLKTVSLEVSGVYGSDIVTKTDVITVLSGPAAAGVISGSATVCRGQNGVVYSVPSISGASAYSWSVPAGASIVAGTNTNSITVNFSSVASSGNISVAGSNSGCTGASSTLAVTVNLDPSPGLQHTFSSTGPVVITDNTISNPYPSVISVSGLLGNIQDVNVILTGLSHTFPDDVDILLAAPSGQFITLMSDCGGGTDLVNKTFTVNDSAASLFSDASANTGSSYRPSNYLTPDNYLSPGPGSYNTGTGASSVTLSSLNGINPNGNWQLYVVDDAGTDFGSLSGWSLQIITNQSIPVIVGPPVVCQGQGSVSYSIPVIDGISGYIWNLPSGAFIVSVANTASITVDFSGSAVSGSISVTPYTACGIARASNPFNVTVNPMPVISSFNPVSGIAGTSVQINGTGFAGTNNVLFNGSAASFVVNNSSLITASVPVSASTGLLQVHNACGTATSAGNFTVIPDSVYLNVKVFVQGFYLGSGTMRPVANPSGHPSVCDTVEIKLAEPVSPFSISHTSRSVIGINGIGMYSFPGSVQGNSYYIVVKHRNTLETWSSSPLLFNSSPVNYDFTDLISKSYGNNQVDLGDGNFAIWSGDINQDGLINLSDMLNLEGSLLNYLSGYFAQDLNGDLLVESADLSLVENNVPLLLIISKP